jgi:hypothetical protein
MLTKFAKLSTTSLPNAHQVCKMITSLPNAYQVGAEIADSLLNEIDDLSSRLVLRNGVSLEDHNTHSHFLFDEKPERKQILYCNYKTNKSKSPESCNINIGVQ